MDHPWTVSQPLLEIRWCPYLSHMWPGSLIFPSKGHMTSYMPWSRQLSWECPVLTWLAPHHMGGQHRGQGYTDCLPPSSCPLLLEACHEGKKSKQSPERLCNNCWVVNKVQIARRPRSEENLRPPGVGQIASRSSGEFCPASYSEATMEAKARPVLLE